jgi:hypothetical protein
LNGRSVSTFIAASGDNCRAFVVDGPTKSAHHRWADNHEYRMDGYLCATAGATVTDADLESYLVSIRLS